MRVSGLCRLIRSELLRHLETLYESSEEDLVAGFCQTEMTALAMKEFDPQLALELLNVLSECRLADVKPLRCSSDVQRPGYFDEVP